MTDTPCSVIFFPGAGGGAPDLDALREDTNDRTRFEVIHYPEWKNCMRKNFSADAMISCLAGQIAATVPQGPIRIVGNSIGGHFGYAAAVRLQAMGREIAGFCAIDSFMIASSGPSAGWKRRALAEGVELIAKGRFGEFAHFLRSKFWRALIRLAGGRLPWLLQRLRSTGWSGSLASVDPILEKEISMRLLIREAAPWIASLDREPVALKAPSVLLRTCRTSADDLAWRRRCPNLQILEISGLHHNLFEAENLKPLRKAYLAATRDWRKAN
jgi:thioesterase domain-containing protein